MKLKSITKLILCSLIGFASFSYGVTSRRIKLVQRNLDLMLKEITRDFSDKDEKKCYHFDKICMVIFNNFDYLFLSSGHYINFKRHIENHIVKLSSKNDKLENYLRLKFFREYLIYCKSCSANSNIKDSKAFKKKEVNVNEKHFLYVFFEKLIFFKENYFEFKKALKRNNNNKLKKEIKECEYYFKKVLKNTDHNHTKLVCSSLITVMLELLEKEGDKFFQRDTSDYILTIASALGIMYDCKSALYVVVHVLIKYDKFKRFDDLFISNIYNRFKVEKPYLCVDNYTVNTYAKIRDIKEVSYFPYFVKGRLFKKKFQVRQKEIIDEFQSILNKYTFNQYDKIASLDLFLDYIKIFYNQANISIKAADELMFKNILKENQSKMYELFLVSLKNLHVNLQMLLSLFSNQYSFPYINKKIKRKDYIIITFHNKNELKKNLYRYKYARMLYNYELCALSCINSKKLLENLMESTSYLYKNYDKITEKEKELVFHSQNKFPTKDKLILEFTISYREYFEDRNIKKLKDKEYDNYLKVKKLVFGNINNTSLNTSTRFYLAYNYMVSLFRKSFTQKNYLKEYLSPLQPKDVDLSERIKNDKLLGETEKKRLLKLNGFKVEEEKIDESYFDLKPGKKKKANQESPKKKKKRRSDDSTFDPKFTNYDGPIVQYKIYKPNKRLKQETESSDEEKVEDKTEDNNEYSGLFDSDFDDVLKKILNEKGEGKHTDKHLPYYTYNGNFYCNNFKEEVIRRAKEYQNYFYFCFANRANYLDAYKEMAGLHKKDIECWYYDKTAKMPLNLHYRFDRGNFGLTCYNGEEVYGGARLGFMQLVKKKNGSAFLNTFYLK